jgi:hypothetical protein
MTDPTPHCPWCSAPLPAGVHETCPSCGATLTSATGAEPDIKGVTTLDPMAIIQARAEVARPRSRIMSFITGEAPGEQPDPSANPESLAPPPDAVRREMRRLEIEAERADLEAETVALKTDVVVEMGIPLSALGGADADLAAAEAPEDEAQQVQAEAARLAAEGSTPAGAPAATPAPATATGSPAAVPPAQAADDEQAAGA